MSNHTKKVRTKMICWLCICVVMLCTLSSSGLTEMHRVLLVPLNQNSCEHADYMMELAEHGFQKDCQNTSANIEGLLPLCDSTVLALEPCKVSYYYVNSGNTLDEVAQTLRHQRYETSVGYSLYGDKIFDYTNYLPSKVYATASYRQEFLDNFGTLAIHNHPSGGPFSVNDLYAEAKFNTPIAMVIGNEYTYMIQPMWDGWGDPEALRLFYSEQIQKYETMAWSYVRNTYRYSAQKLLNEPERQDDGSLKWYCDNAVRKALYGGSASGTIMLDIGTWYYDKALKETAKKFNLLYVRELTDVFDFTNIDVCRPATECVPVMRKSIERVFY